MKTVQIMLGNEVRDYFSDDDAIKPGHVAVIEGQSGFVTANVLKVTPIREGLYPIAASFDYKAYGAKVDALNARNQAKAELMQSLANTVNQLSRAEIREKFPELGTLVDRVEKD